MPRPPSGEVRGFARTGCARIAGARIAGARIACAHRGGDTKAQRHEAEEGRASPTDGCSFRRAAQPSARPYQCVHACSPLDAGRAARWLRRSRRVPSPSASWPFCLRVSPSEHTPAVGRAPGVARSSRVRRAAGDASPQLCLAALAALAAQPPSTRVPTSNRAPTSTRVSARGRRTAGDASRPPSASWPSCLRVSPSESTPAVGRAPGVVRSPRARRAAGDASPPLCLAALAAQPASTHVPTSTRVPASTPGPPSRRHLGDRRRTGHQRPERRPGIGRV